MPVKNKARSLSKKFKVLFLLLWFYVLPFSICFCSPEPPRYEITADIDTLNHKISAEQKVTFTNNSDKEVDDICFHIYPHRKYTKKEIRFMYRYAGYFKVNPFPEGFQSGDLNIGSVTSSGKTLTYIVEGDDQTILRINLDAPLKPGETREIDLKFLVSIPHSYGKFGWHKEITTLVRWYPILCVLDNAGWHNYPFYIYHQPYFSEAAYYKVKVTLPGNEKIVSTGSIKEEFANSDGTKQLVLETEYPVRDFSLGISKYFSVYSLSEEKTKINAYYLPGDEIKAQQAAKFAQELMRFYAQRFGAYPYKEFNIVPSYLGYGGVQSSGQVFIDTRVYKLPKFLDRYFDFLIAHESGHQWFFNIIGSDEYREMFLDEGMNSYWLLQYLENKYGIPAEIMQLPKFLKWLIPNYSFRDSTIARYVYLAKRGMDQPVVGDLSSFHEPSSIFALTYGKGSAVLSMLHELVGDATFNKIMSNYSSEFRFKNISLDEFIRICNKEYGSDLNWFFKSWLKTRDNCDYAVKSVVEEKVVLENKGLIEMPVDTKLIYQDGTESIEHWDGKGKSKIITPKNKIKKVELDYDEKIVLDLDRTNNNWPRKRNIKPVPLYYFVYDIPVFLPRDSYNLVVGPSVKGSSLGLASSLSKPYDGSFKVSSSYDFSEKSVDSVIGYEFDHLLGKQTSLGVELFNRESSKDKHDLSGGKVYLRKELWPASYGVFDLNDHATLYLIRDQKIDRTSSLNGGEDLRNINYRKRDETIVGMSGSFGRYGPYSDPDYGWKFIPTQEFAGHFLGGKDSFWRSSVELDKYQLLLPKYQHKIAAHMKLGWGEEGDKNLFQLGGADGLRGYSAHELEGAHMMLGSAEYRFPVATEMKVYFLDNILCLDKIQAVGFVDVGKTWYTSFSSSKFKKDVGLGLRFHFDVLGFLEKMVVRLDVAKGINEHKEGPHVWFGLSHTF